MLNCAIITCTNEARVGMRTTRNMQRRGRVNTEIWWDIVGTPPAATLYCNRCAQKVLKNMCKEFLPRDSKVESVR